MLLDVSRLIWRRWAGVRPTGIDRICMAWMVRYADQAQATIVHRRGHHILSRVASRELFPLLADDVAHASSLAATRLRLARWAARHISNGFASRSGAGRFWLNVGHTGLDQPSLVAWCAAVDIKPVLMVHDLIPLTHPQYCRAGEAERHSRRMHTLLRISAGIIGNSQHTIDTLAKFAEREHLPMAPAMVAWPGTPRMPVKAVRSDSANCDFIILGTIEGRKNHRLLLDVWRNIIHFMGSSAPRLLIVGRRGWACDDVLSRLNAGEGGDRIVETGPLDDRAIATHLGHARALLFPSFTEGYGLPLVEALDAGVPVIAADLPVFREIGQGVPDLLPPDDHQGWFAAISKYAMPDSPDRAAQIARMTGFQTPTWLQHFERVDRFLASLYA